LFLMRSGHLWLCRTQTKKGPPGANAGRPLFH
jgi:hypothetical protein